MILHRAAFGNCCQTLNNLSRRSLAKADQLSTINCLESLLGGAFAKKLGNIEVHEIGVMKNN